MIWLVILISGVLISGVLILVIIPLYLLSRVLPRGTDYSRLQKIEPDSIHKQIHPYRFVVVHASRAEYEKLHNEKYLSNYLLVYKWDRAKLKWHKVSKYNPGALGSELYIVDDLEDELVGVKSRKVLTRELEKLMTQKVSILLCGRIVPGYWLSESTSGQNVGSSSEEEISRWCRLLCNFDMYRLDVDNDIKQCFNKCPTEGTNKHVHEVMLSEAKAHPDFCELALRIAKEYSECTDVEDAHEAIGKFKAGATAHFNSLWAASTLDERLLLLTLARGGFANSVQCAALSSLADRRLIEIEKCIKLRSDALAEFIFNDLTHDSLLSWQREGHRDRWKSIWPPVAIISGLILLFLLRSNPELVITILLALPSVALGITQLLARQQTGLPAGES